MNIFWPVYKNLESEFSKLMYHIHIDDFQKNVYSSKIADILLRSVVEIESISKDLYVANGGIKTSYIRYDEDAIKFLNKKWLLDKKTVLISSTNCFFTNKEILPFVKNETRTGKSNKTYSWNNSYQNIKHDRAKNLKYGNIKYLFDSMAALYLLNLYYSDLTFDLDKDAKGISLSPNMGSNIFSVIISAYSGHNGNDAYIKGDDFEKSVFYINQTAETSKILFDSMKAFNAKLNELALLHPKVLVFLKNNDISKIKENWLWEALGQEEYVNLLRQAQCFAPLNSKQVKYEAVLNKNQLI